MNLRARRKQIEFFDDLLERNDPVLLAIYGRRRIGKTFLVTEFFKNKKVNFFHLTEVKNAANQEQIENFKDSWRDCFKEHYSEDHQNWTKALNKLAHKLKKETRPNVIFLDELPWLAKKNLDF